MPDHFHRLRQAPTRWATPIAVVCGGLLGSGVRAATAEVIQPSPGGIPIATLVVNLLGSLLLGLYLARRERAAVGRLSLRFWAIGALGSFTTFSAFSLEVVRLVDGGAVTTALVYVLASTVGGLAAALVGDRLGSSLP